MALRADDVDLDRDRALVQRFQAGDDEAFDELFRRYHDRLERFCLRRLGDRHAAEEVAQETFTRALGALPELGGEQRFYPWLTVIAARLCVDCFRRQARSEPRSDPNPGGITGDQVEDIIDAVDSTLVITALARLAPRHQDVLHLREVEGWSYRRIAEHYGVTVGTVETLLFRARQALRREFRIVDGAGLAAMPFLGAVVRVAVRVRNRLPAVLPSTPMGGTLAAGAVAGAAAVALVVMPGRVPVKPLAPVAMNHARTHHRTWGQSSGSGIATTESATPVTVTPDANIRPDFLDGTTATVTTTSTTLPAAGGDTTGTTTTTLPSSAGGAVGEVLGSSLVGTTMTGLNTAVAPVAALPQDLTPLVTPPVSLPLITVPALDLGSIVGTVASTGQGVVGTLLPPVRGS